MSLMLQSAGIYAEAINPSHGSILFLKNFDLAKNRTKFSTGQFFHHKQVLETPICESDMRLGQLDNFSVKVPLKLSSRRN